MNRLIPAVLLAALAAAPALAHDEVADKSGPMHHETAAEEGVERRELSVDKVKKELGLSEEQAGKLDAAVKAKREAVKPLREQLKAGFDLLSSQVDAKAADADIAATLDKIAAAHKA